jgi:hypothetical protein
MPNFEQQHHVVELMTCVLLVVLCRVITAAATTTNRYFGNALVVLGNGARYTGAARYWLFTLNIEDG